MNVTTQTRGTRSTRLPSRLPVLVALALPAAFALGACAKAYVAADFGQYLARTKTFAIAPIANLTTEPEGAKAGQAIREAIYWELGRKSDEYTVSIQELAMTDKLLRDAGLTDSAIAKLPAVELSKVLGVDAVMRGSVTKFKKSGAAGQIATSVLFGWAKGSEVVANVAIFDGTDGRMVYQHNIEKAGGLLSSPDALRDDVGRAIANQFPYRKKVAEAK